MTKTLFEIKDLSFSISKKIILNSISLKIFEGEYLSIIGPNGAGKTTLLKCLMRIYKADQKKILFNGITLDNFNQKDLAKQISYVPQSDGRSFPFTVKEFVMMGRYPHLSPFTSINSKDKEAVQHSLELTKIIHLAERYMDTLSGGERQTVFIAAALAQGSKILLLDEPTTFLDPKHESEIYKILKKINYEYKMTIISVTHDINGAALHSDRIAIIKNGSIGFVGNAQNVMQTNILEQAYDKSFLFINHPETGQLFIAPEVMQNGK